MYIDDCVKGIDTIMHCNELIATPINLGSDELISINDLVSLLEEIASVKLERYYDLTAPRVWLAETVITPSSNKCWLGAGYHAAERYGENLYLDQAAICGP